MSAVKSTLLKLLPRAGRGFTTYEKLPIVSLRNLVKKRNLGSAKGPKQFLVHLLQIADDAVQLRFRLLDLPPELRVRIYELYFESLGAVYSSSQPPITRVCRALRVESLPLFYQTCRFYLEVRATARHADFLPPWEAGRAKRITAGLCMSDRTHRFLQALSDTYLGQIRHIRLGTVVIRSANRWDPGFLPVCDIDLSRDSGEVRIPLKYRYLTTGNNGFRERVEAFVREIAARVGGQKLRKEDVDRLLALGDLVDEGA
ncbi:hypothetical protein LTR37_015129 [Vermiconidia calcicola]|uniref:Uncharacterized protein n=1 Tax=Vermiconidia calcicola TaxID=1690605 RepID=A0ACC3MRI1_9PEZI|nr:hypothetical protein LTR37_015129 [Vermiconidia calcicola]